MRLLGFGGSAIIALVTGAGMMAEWPTLALFWYAPAAMGSVIDPIFGKPLNFFLFTLPAWQLISGWLLTLAIIVCAVAVFFILITGGADAFAGRRSYLTIPWRGLSITFAFLLLILAMRVYLSRFDLLFEDHTVFGGVTYTDAHITLARPSAGMRSPGRRGHRGRGKRHDGGAGTLAAGGDSARDSLLCRRSRGRVVDEQLYRQTK